MRFVKRISIVAACLPISMNVLAEEPDTTDVAYSIVEHITMSGIHTVSHPDAMSQRLFSGQMTKASDDDNTSAVSAGVHTGGYRIQIFSDSNPRTARNEANAKAGNIASRFPEYKSYVTYDAPYWRLRIGDFRTYEDAIDVLEAIKETFPAYRRELRVVRDRINVN